MSAKVKISALCIAISFLIGCNNMGGLAVGNNQSNQIEAVVYNSSDENIIEYAEYDYKNLRNCEIEFWIEIYENGALVNKISIDKKSKKYDQNYMGTVGYYVKNIDSDTINWMLRHDQSFYTFETSNFFEKYQYTKNNIMTNNVFDYNTECVLVEYVANKDEKPQSNNVNKLDNLYYSDLISNNDFVYLLKFKPNLR